MSAIDQIFDPDNTDPIVLYNGDDQEVRFEQIAVIPIDGSVYVILKPVESMEGVGENEALVFTIMEENGEEVLTVEERDDVIDAVFAEYYNMLEEVE